MLCRTCMRRCLQTIIGDRVSISTLQFSSNRPRTREITTTARVYTNPEDAQAYDDAPDGKRRFFIPKPDFRVKPDAPSTSFKRQRWLESRGVTPAHKRVEEKADDLLIRKQLKHLQDPLKLAQHVRETLREDDFESALAIVRAASKDNQCIVSWNHLIDWQLSKGKMKDAIKTYNEMKKRAQTPDAYTYTIIFRGCAEHPLPAQALPRVITIYNSMMTEKSPIRPNTIHMNAVLKMCAKAGDMDALFAIASDLPAKGSRAPNKLTYTIIFNAIRVHVLTSLRGNLTEVQKRKIRRQATQDARHFWTHVVQRWRQGDILIDEELVCTMGRVLLLGEDEDIDDVLTLIEQTMDIPRQAPSIRHRKSEENALKEAKVKANRGKEDAATSSKTIVPDYDADASLTPLHEDKTESGDSSTTALVTKTGKLFTRPGQNTLSLLMEAILDLRIKEPASKYWHILTNEYGVDPDAANYHGYLRILRVARASTETVKVLSRMPQQYMEVKTFRIAMSTCHRDKNNQHAFANAGKVLDFMQTAFPIPDTQVLCDYLESAFSVGAYSKKASSNGEHGSSKYEQGKQVMRALARLNPSYVNLRSLVAYGDPSKPTLKNDEKAHLVDSVLTLTRRLVSAYDFLIHKEMVSRDQFDDLIGQRRKLAAFVTRFKDRKNLVQRKTPSGGLPMEVEKNRDLYGMTKPAAGAKSAGPGVDETLAKDTADSNKESLEEK